MPRAIHNNDAKQMKIHTTSEDPLYKLGNYQAKAPTMLDHVKSPPKHAKISKNKEEVSSGLCDYDAKQLKMLMHYQTSPKVLGHSIKGVIYPHT